MEYVLRLGKLSSQDEKELYPVGRRGNAVSTSPTPSIPLIRLYNLLSLRKCRFKK